MVSVVYPQHGCSPIHAIIDDEEVIVARKHVFVDEVHAPFLRCAADLVAVFHKTCKSLVASIAPGFVDRIMSLCNM